MVHALYEDVIVDLKIKIPALMGNWMFSCFDILNRFYRRGWLGEYQLVNFFDGHF